MTESSDPFLPPLRDDAAAVEMLSALLPQLRKKTRKGTRFAGGSGRLSPVCSSSGPKFIKKHVEKKVDFGCVDFHHFPMNDDEIGVTLLKVNNKRKEPKMLTVSIEVYEFLRYRGIATALRDACDLADECGELSSNSWSVVWDSRDGASFYFPDVQGRRFSDLKGFEAIPVRIPRFRAIDILDDWWECFDPFRECAGSFRTS